MKNRGRSIFGPGDPLVIFVASASRSGSTLLDFLLGSHPDGISTGELRQLQGFALQDRKACGIKDKDYALTCSCGIPVGECVFWKKVEQELGVPLHEIPSRSRASRHWRAVVMSLYMVFGSSVVRGLARLWPALMKEIEIGHNCVRIHQAISRVSGASFVVDSSKSIYHYMLLHLAAPERLRLIVLVRDGRAVAYSMVRGTRANQWGAGSSTPFVQAARQWVRTNRAILLLSRRTLPSHRTLIGYEDLCHDPHDMRQAVAVRWGLPQWDPRVLIQQEQRHIIGGSPSVRFEKSVNQIAVDESWKDALSEEDLKAFEHIGGRLNRRLGYR